MNKPVKKKIIIFGTSSSLDKTLPYIKDLQTIEFLVDNNEEKWNTNILLNNCIYSIQRPQVLLSINLQEYIVIIASMYVDEITQQLKDMVFELGYQTIPYKLLSQSENQIVHYLQFAKLKKRSYSEYNFPMYLFQNIGKLIVFLDIIVSKIIISAIYINNQKTTNILAKDILLTNGKYIDDSCIIFWNSNSTIIINNSDSYYNISIKAKIINEEKSIPAIYVQEFFKLSNIDLRQHNNIHEEFHVKLLETDVKTIAFYLPQFYTFHDNDTWWGKGFTEWSNATKTNPLYHGHYQPHLPIDLGFYNANSYETRNRQIQLAKKYGIFGFCFYYYWFDGKRMMEKPLDEYINDKTHNYPFCICWANEKWSRTWDAREKELLLIQNYSDFNYLSCIQNIATYIKDHRYIKVKGKPMIIVYKLSEIPNPKKMTNIWRDYCIKQGIGEIHLVCAMTSPMKNPTEYGFDAILEFPPHLLSNVKEISSNVQMYIPHYNGKIFDYEDLVTNKKYFKDNFENKECLVYKTAFPNWDNTARKYTNALIYHKYRPELYEKWLSDIFKYTLENPMNKENYVFINAWNEWAEGCHLEPDMINGYSMLKVTGDAVINSRKLIIRK